MDALTTVLIAAVAAPLLSWIATILTKLFVFRTASVSARERIEQIERTLAQLERLRDATVVSEAEYRKLMEQVVESALTIDRGERLLQEAKRVNVEGDPVRKEDVFRSAERSLQERFSAEAAPSGSP